MSKVLKRLCLGDVVKSFGTKQLRKLTTEKPQTESVIGTWVFNENVDFSMLTNLYDRWYIDFISSDVEFDSLRANKNVSAVTYEQNLQNNYSAYTNGEWQTNSLRTIIINGGDDVNNATFVSWLKANATKIESIVGSTGLAYTSNGDGTCYVSGIGTCSDTDVVIPTTSPDGDTVTRIGQEAFHYNTSIRSVIIGNSVRTVGAFAFSSCSSLTSVKFNFGTTNIGSNAFAACKLLASVELPESLMTIEMSAFSGCKALASITIPDSVRTIESSAFYGCGLISIIIPQNVTSLRDRAFQNCYSLKSVVLNGRVGEIDEFTFSGCNSLEHFTFPYYVANIARRAFSHCTSLQSIVIGHGVKKIEEEAFYECMSLNEITYNYTVSKWGEITLGENWNYNVPATEVICTDGTITIAR